jgi:hypothetical protein
LYEKEGRKQQLKKKIEKLLDSELKKKKEKENIRGNEK